MKQYREFQPTQFDRKGAFLQDQGEWLVVPVSQTRDSGCLEQSNFSVALEMLGGESEVVEVHRFGHWGPGWFEIIIIDPAAQDKVKIAGEIESALEDYPVLSDGYYSDLEFNTACEVWKNMSIRDRIDVCNRFNISFLKSRHDEIPEDDGGEIISYLAE